MVNRRGHEEASAGAGRVTKRFCELYALLATQFSLLRRQTRQQGARRYVPILVTTLTALFMCLLKFKIFDVVF